MSQEVITNTMLPLVLKLAQDPVPNIRFNVAKTLHSLIPLLDSSVVQTKIKPCLQELLKDSDRDVKFYASQALQSC